MITVTLQNEAWDDVEEGTEALLDEWLVKAGTPVKAGEIIAIVVVAKTSFEVVAPADGTVSKLLVGLQEGVTRGQPLLEFEPEI